MSSMHKWRVKYYYLAITPTKKLIITLRKFKTSKKKRAARSIRLALLFPFYGVREVAIRFVKKPRRKRKAAKSSARILFAAKQFLSIVMVLIGLVGAIYFALQSRKPSSLEPTNAVVLQTPTPAKAVNSESLKGMPRSEPTHIRIPSVEIDYGIIAVGRQENGTMEVPPLFENITGWYKYSPTPGEIGPAVIVGHVDTIKGPSVFWRLRELKPGDIIEITRADGQTVKFKVDVLKQFEQNNFPTAEVYGNITHAGLRVITCGGTYDKATDRYSANTVVFASIIPPTPG